MTCDLNLSKKWQKFSNLIQNDPASKVVLIQVPKGFDPNLLNATSLDLKKKMKKAQESSSSIITRSMIKSTKQPCLLEVTAANKNSDTFESGAHMKQILTLLPKQGGSGGNLEMMNKGI